MDAGRLLDGLAGELDRLRAAAAPHLTAPVPTCPEWTVTDLVGHVAHLYGNVVVPRFGGAGPVETGGEPLAALERGYAAMVAGFAGREPGDKVGSLPHETVYYWIRRMLHETAIHRVDAELAAGTAVVPLAEDLAVDGIDELLVGFLAELTRLFPEEFAAHLSDWNGRWLAVSAGRTAWRITVHPDHAEVIAGAESASAEIASAEIVGAETSADARIEGAPGPLLYWLYNRAGDDAVTVEGDPELVARFRRLLTAVSNTG